MQKIERPVTILIVQDPAESTSQLWYDVKWTSYSKRDFPATETLDKLTVINLCSPEKIQPEFADDIEKEVHKFG